MAVRPARARLYSSRVGRIFGKETDMKWQLAGDWPVGAALIPTGTMLAGVAGADGPLAEPPSWHGQPLPMPMPLNATALDEEAALQMCMWYEEAASIGGWHQLHFAAGIDREAVRARARHNKRWPRGHVVLR